MYTGFFIIFWLYEGMEIDSPRLTRNFKNLAYAVFLILSKYTRSVSGESDSPIHPLIIKVSQ